MPANTGVRIFGPYALRLFDGVCRVKFWLLHIIRALALASAIALAHVAGCAKVLFMSATDYSPASPGASGQNQYAVSYSALSVPLTAQTIIPTPNPLSGPAQPG